MMNQFIAPMHKPTLSSITSQLRAGCKVLKRKYLAPGQALSTTTCIRGRTFATQATLNVPKLEAGDISYAKRIAHQREVDQNLRQDGILRIQLQFPDAESTYLRHLIVGLHENFGHQLPVNHSAERGWFWDVKPSSTTFQSLKQQARSETMEEFPWHTDCSYEDPTPRYFALQVIQNDRLGGGTLSVTNVERLCRMLSKKARLALARREFEITTPPEFVKDARHRSIIGRLLAADVDGVAAMRFRDDILTPLSGDAGAALAELKDVLRQARDEPNSMTTLHLSSERDMPNGTILLLNNRRWLHARNEVRDPERHLRRVRWDAVPFSVHRQD